MDRVAGGLLVAAGLGTAAWVVLAAGSAHLVAELATPTLLPALFAALGGALVLRQARLRRDEARFRALTELSSDWYWETDSGHRLVRLEGNGARHMQHLLGRRVWEIESLREDEARWREHRAQLERREPFSGFVLRSIGPDGQPRWSSVSGEPVFSAGGRFLGYRGTGRNITAQKLAERRLKKRLLELDAILENASVGIALARDGRIVRCSRALQEMFGYGAQAMHGLEERALWPSQADWEALRAQAAAALAAGRRYESERLARRADGSQFCARVLAGALKRDDLSKGTIWIVEDITERKCAAERLFAEKERAQATLQAIGEAVIVADRAGWIEFMNPEAERLTGCDLLQAAGAQVAAVLNLADEESGAPLEDPVTQVLAGGIVAQGAGVRLERADGAHLVVDYSAAPVRNAAHEIVGAVVALRDVTSAREMARKVSWQATHDELTGLVNRREFERRLGEALAEVRRSGAAHALLFLDLDQFKVVNDTCGHAAGDELLRQITQALARQIRHSDTLARLGGDEFGVLLAHCPIEQAGRVAEALRRTVEQFHFTWQDKIFRVGVSIGGVPLADPEKSLAEVMSAADAACYHAKDSGRNRVHLVTAGDGEIAERHGQMQWVARIHRALEEDRLRLWYQEIRPISERALAAEAARGDRYELLLRMVDEQGALVPPMAFLPAAERYHLMPVLDRWVVEHALAFIERCYATGARRLASASINLSGASVGDPNFLDFLEGQLARRRVEPQALCFEITETTAVADLARAARFIAALKAIGCRFSLDDFGSGMSSFAYLKNLPVDYLKIDGSFVKQLHRDPIDCAMVEAIHRVGHVMGIATIAEFVESGEILERLRAIGVDYAQGYGIARPQPLESLAALAQLPQFKGVNHVRSRT
jgi:diguanylate cyclase (GGDEF)-like protein/PAS domain S-box-containing protein